MNNRIFKIIAFAITFILLLGVLILWLNKPSAEQFIDFVKKNPDKVNLIISENGQNIIEINSYLVEPKHENNWFLIAVELSRLQLNGVFDSNGFVTKNEIQAANFGDKAIELFLDNQNDSLKNIELLRFAMQNRTENLAQFVKKHYQLDSLAYTAGYFGLDLDSLISPQAHINLLNAINFRTIPFKINYDLLVELCEWPMFNAGMSDYFAHYAVLNSKNENSLMLMGYARPNNLPKIEIVAQLKDLSYLEMKKLEGSLKFFQLALFNDSEFRNLVVKELKN